MDVLLTGATGFIGHRLYPALIDAGHNVVCASRNPGRAAELFPGRQWAYLEVSDVSSMRTVLRGCDAAFYLVHGMAEGDDYPRREERAARAFAEAAEFSGLSHLVYLGGMAPAGPPSRHLASRLRTGSVLREGRIPTTELRASMIIGPGGASWQICRDLAMRLPVMVLPKWLHSRTQPVAVADVIYALVASLALGPGHAGDHDMPGPETMMIREILERIAHLAGTRPVMIEVPMISPHLSTYWIRLVTRANHTLTTELVEGLRSDILARGEGIWSLLPEHERMSFDEAARQALEEDDGTESRLAHAFERTVHAAARKL